MTFIEYGLISFIEWFNFLQLPLGNIDDERDFSIITVREQVLIPTLKNRQNYFVNISKEISSFFKKSKIRQKTYLETATLFPR